MRFLFVDDILDLDPGRRIRAMKSIAPEEDYFPDHFPGFPVVPGVLLIEMLGQAAAKCLRAGDPARGRPMLAQVKSAVFRDWVRPGTNVVLLAEVVANRESYATAACRAEVEGREVASAQLLFAFLPASQFTDGCGDEVLERYLARARDGRMDAH